MISVGICSWTEKSLMQSGEFYPEQARTAEDRLRFYAGNFDTVEVDSSYYAIPAQNTVWLWTQRTPHDFTFHIKVYGGLTGHGVDPRTLPREIRTALPSGEAEKGHIFIKEPDLIEALAAAFADALSPLRRSGKLGLLVFQFPPWFHYSPANLDRIHECKRHASGMPVAVEFRHGSWLTPKRADGVFRFLREHGITYIAADEPQYGSLATVPFLPEVTTDIAYFRFHGRNRETWLKNGIETSLRYAYEYSEDELMEFRPAVVKADTTARKTYVMFNNCRRGYAVRNARRMKEMVQPSGDETAGVLP